MINLKKLFRKKTIQASFPACFAFSQHKSGSTLMNKMIQEVCHIVNIPGISIADDFFKLNIEPNVWENDEDNLKLITPGQIYFGFRHLPNFLLNEKVHLNEKKSVLLIRDPRDALVSQYFSVGGKYISHTLPDMDKESFLEKLQLTAHMDIDEYVLHAAILHSERLTAYKEKLNFENVRLFKYEDIYYDKRKFIGDIFMHFNIPIESRVLDEVSAKNDIRPEVEDVAKHIRKGTPGDHMAKLRPETIRKLNEIFFDACAWFGYDLR
jgi:hypothetical protein